MKIATGMAKYNMLRYDKIFMIKFELIMSAHSYYLLTLLTMITSYYPLGDFYFLFFYFLFYKHSTG